MRENKNIFKWTLFKRFIICTKFLQNLAEIRWRIKMIEWIFVKWYKETGMYSNEHFLRNLKFERDSDKISRRLDKD